MEEEFVCEFCGRKYDSKDKLNSHLQANHWKLLHPKKHGKPSKPSKLKILSERVEKLAEKRRRKN